MMAKETHTLPNDPPRWPVRVTGGVFCAALLALGVFGFVTDFAVASLGLVIFALPLLMAGVVVMLVGWRMRWWDWAVLAAGAIYLWRALVSPVPHLVTTEVALLLTILGAYMAGRLFFSLRSMRLALLWTLVVLQAGQALMSFWQWTGDQGVSVLFFLGMERPEVVERISGFAFHPNIHGAVCAMLLPWFVAYLFFGRGGSERSAGALGLGLSLFGLAFTFSRAALLGAIGGLAVFFVLWLCVVVGGRMSRARKLAMAGTVLVFAMVVAGGIWKWLPIVAETRFGTDDIAQLEVAHGREEYWDAALGQFLDAPFLGHGARSYSYLSYQYWPQSAWVRIGDPVFAHNEYYQMLADYGLSGLLIFVMAGGILVVVALGRIRPPGKGGGRPWVIGGIAAFAAVLLDAIFSFTPHAYASAGLAALLVGGMVTGGRSRGESLRVGVPVVPGVALFLVGAALLSLALPLARAGWVRYPAERDYMRGNLELEQLVEAYETAHRYKAWYPVAQTAGILSWRKANEHGVLGERDASTEWLHRAESHLAEAIRLFPQNPVPHLYHGRLLGNLGRFEEADEALNEAWRLGRHREWFLQIHVARANHYRLWAARMMEQRQGEKAREMINKAIDQLNATQLRGPDYEETRRQTEALAELIELLY